MSPLGTLKAIIRYTEGMDTLITDLELNRFQLLVAVILSSRTREEMTLQAVRKFAEKVGKPEDLLEMDESEIESIIRGVAFHRNKARMLKRLAKMLVEEYGGRVPGSREELLKLPGVGRKTANLILSAGFGKPAICVDTHVHRISNRIGWVETRNPEETEKGLMRIFPKEWWSKINRALVVFGRNVCKPRNPLCQSCPIKGSCKYFSGG